MTKKLNKYQKCLEDLKKNWNKINIYQRACEYSGGDPWGPSGQDLNDAYDDQDQILIKILKKHFK